ncbi:MAG: CmcJ/NvfI family oxidoreductase [Allosphingosinicella sp.]
MTAHTRITAAAIEAPLNFLRPMVERPVSYQFDPPPGVPVRTGQYGSHVVAIHDARPLAATLSLDVEGFALLRAPSGLGSFDDGAAIRTVYYPEVERLIAAATGAERVVTFDHNVRSAARAARGDPGIRGPVGRAHNDFTDKSGRERAQRELWARGLDARWLQRRFAIVNLWRPIGRPVEKSPLALVDARSLADGDLVAADLVYRDRVGETYALQFNSAQLWYHFPLLTPDEAILIKGYDSAANVARFTAHSAFDDPTSRPDAPERESIEARALVIYPDDPPAA